MSNGGDDIAAAGLVSLLAMREMGDLVRMHQDSMGEVWVMLPADQFGSPERIRLLTEGASMLQVICALSTDVLEALTDRLIAEIARRKGE